MKNKYLLVTLADKDFIDQAKQLFSSAYHNGGWDGDYMLLSNDIPEKELKWFRKKGILIKKCKPFIKEKIGKWPASVLSKICLFKEEFKRWDKIIFLDGDIIVRYSLKKLLRLNGFYASYHYVRLKQELKRNDEKKFNRLNNTYDLNKRAFNSGVLVFSTDIIKKETFNELKKLALEYHSILDGDEPLLNLYFQRYWRELPIVYNLSPQGLSRKYEIKNINGVIIHFVKFKKPWDKLSKYYNEWNHNLLLSNSINIKKPKQGKLLTLNQKKAIIKRIKRQSFIFMPILIIDRKIGEVGIYIKKISPRLYYFLKNKKDGIWKLKISLDHFLKKTNERARDLIRPLRIKRIDKNKIKKDPNEIRLFMKIRNESLRLPYIFEHYKKLGVDRFFIIDNNSTDDSVQFLLPQKNTHIFETKESYKKANLGDKWINYLLNRYGKNHWCLVVDADEILIYPNYEKISLKQLCEFLEKEKSSTLNSYLLDMYSNKSIKDSIYKRGGNPFNIFNYFDAEEKYIEKKDNYYDPDTRINFKNIKILRGGMRKRVFNTDDFLNKICLFKFNEKTKLIRGHHLIVNNKISKVQGAVLHFKYGSDFFEVVKQGVKTQTYYNNSEKYRLYYKKLKQNPNLNLFYNKSIKFKNSKQQVSLKKMKTSKEFEEFTKSIKNKN